MARPTSTKVARERQEGSRHDLHSAGEALGRVLQLAPQLLPQLTDAKRIVAFRNRLIHGYATVRHALVWDIVQTKLPKLKEEVAKML